MTDIRNDKFNKEFKHKLKDAAYTPSAHIWDGVEAALLKAENAKMKKRAVFYRNVAASLILLAFISIYFNFSDNILPFQKDLVQATQIENSNAFTNVDDAKPSQPRYTNDVIANSSSVVKNEGLFNQTNSNQFSSNKTGGLAAANTQSQTNSTKQGLPLELNTDRETTSLAYLNKIELDDNFNQNELYLNREINEVSYFETEEYSSNNSSSKLSFMADLNLGSGSFNPNSTATGNPSTRAIVSNGSEIASREVNGKPSTNSELINELSSAPMRSNFSLTYGLNFGLNINDRLQIKSGFQYGNYRSTSESSTVIRDLNTNDLYPYHAASSIASDGDGKIISVTSPYNLYNDFEILSVPVFMSYKIFDWKLGVSVLAGATTDFMLSNTITGASEQLSTLNFNKDANTAYKDVFASGVIGLEFSYNLGKHYALTLTPQYKQALSDITTANSAFRSTPAFASVNMSFQYLF